MTIDADILIDRKKHKQTARRWRNAAFILLAGLLLTVAAQQGDSLPFGKHFGTHIGKGFIARVTIEGEMMEHRPMLELLDDLQHDDNVKALILSVDSPGGAAVAGEAIYKKLRTISAEKPVVTVMGNTAASAAYMVSLGTNYILAHESTITGSVGALFEIPNVKELSDKVGVHMHTIKSGDLKAEPSMYGEISAPARAVLQSMASEVLNMFVRMIVESRHLPEETVRQYADGRVLSGGQAVQAKLVDAIGDEEEALAWLETEKKISKDLPVQDVKIREKLSEWQELLEGSKAVWHHWLLGAQGQSGILSKWQNNVIN